MSNNSNKINIAIFGFGRIGRNIFRLAYKDPRFNIVAISEFGHSESLHYLLARDSVHGKLQDSITLEGNRFLIGDQSVKILPEKSRERYPGQQWTLILLLMLQVLI